MVLIFLEKLHGNGVKLILEALFGGAKNIGLIRAGQEQFELTGMLISTLGIAEDEFRVDSFVLNTILSSHFEEGNELLINPLDIALVDDIGVTLRVLCLDETSHSLLKHILLQLGSS